MPTVPEKMKCSCGYETEYRCRVHPARPAHWMPTRDARGAIWLCHDCEALLNADPGYKSGYGAGSEYAVMRFLERTFCLCSGCAHEMAIIEQAIREVDAFEAALLTSAQFMPEAEAEVERMLEAHRREVWLMDNPSEEPFKI